MSTARYSSSASGAGLLVLEDVTVGYPGGPAVLERVSLDVQPGEVAGLASLDASGGRSTLVRVAAGLLPPWSGRVLFDGEDVYAMGFTQDQSFRARLAAVLEGGALLVNQTVRENVALPLRYHLGLSGLTLHRTVDRLLAQAGFNEDPGLFTWQVSARGRRLAAFARALARQPKLIIVDRFFEGLEMPDWKRLFELVLELNHQDGVSWLLVSELDPAIFQVAERVAVLEGGRVLDYGHRKRLYRDERIKAAFEAAEEAGQETQEARSAPSDSRSSQPRPGESQDSDRILIVESNEELAEILGTDSAEATIAAFGFDPAGTIAIDGQIDGDDAGARAVAVGYAGGVDPEQTMTLEPPDPPPARPKLVAPPAKPAGKPPAKPSGEPPATPAGRPGRIDAEETLTITPGDVAAARAALGDDEGGAWIEAARPPVTRKPSSKSTKPPPAPVKLDLPPAKGGRRPAGGEETVTIDGLILDEVKRRIGDPLREAQGSSPEGASERCREAAPSIAEEAKGQEED